MTHATVHTTADIEKMLGLGLSPITDNVAALVELGFEQSFPNARRGGYEASIYERDLGHRSSGRGSRRKKPERAFLLLSKVQSPNAA